MCHLVYILVGHVASKRLVQFHQVLVDRFRLLPLFEYHYPHLVPQPWAKVILQPDLHAADENRPGHGPSRPVSDRRKQDERLDGAVFPGPQAV